MIKFITATAAKNDSFFSKVQSSKVMLLYFKAVAVAL